MLQQGRADAYVALTQIYTQTGHAFKRSGETHRSQSETLGTIGETKLR
jgi:hypothetical protein